jgi:hypothetical protein
VVGNPPWVNWESLSGEYRKATSSLWDAYGIFPHKGMRARLGSGKDDLSVLMMYAAADHYLKKDGRLGFVITQTVFQSKGGGEGFRRFQLGDRGDHLQVLHVDDMSSFQPFEGATNRTSVVVLRKGGKTAYPVPYTLWRKNRGKKVQTEHSLNEVIAETERVRLVARPVDSSSLTSPWIVGRERVINVLKQVQGSSEYRARAGTCTWANGVYWIELLDKRPDDVWVIRNLDEVGRLQVKPVQAPIEPDLVYPLLRGRDVQRWSAVPSIWVVVPQDMSNPKNGYPEMALKKNLPLTYGYLKRFEDLLLGRSGYRKFLRPQNAPFYSIYNVGGYTFAPYKVVWREVASGINAAVVSDHRDNRLGDKMVIPDHTLVLVPCESADEAHFVCATLNSSPSRLVVQAYVALHPSPHVLQYIAVPRFDVSNFIHTRLAALSQQAHELAAAGGETGLADIEAQVDEAAAEVWGITDRELKEIRRSLEELG